MEEKEAIEGIRHYNEDVFNDCLPRLYKPVKGYPKPEVWQEDASFLINSIKIGMKAFPNRKVDPVSQGLAYTVIENILHKCPMYWVDRDLLIALMQTHPPESMKLADFEFPIPCGIFLLPSGAVLAPGGYEVPYLAFNTIHHKEVNRGYRDIFLSPNINPSLAVGFVTREPDASSWHRNTELSVPMSEVIRAPDTLILSGVQRGMDIYRASEEELRFIDHMTGLAISILLVMAARPTLITDGDKIRSVKHKARGKISLYNPRWVGRYYKPPVGPGLGGTHASPRTHLRAGHLRGVRYGEGRKLTKIIWIEPTWVNLTEENDERKK